MGTVFRSESGIGTFHEFTLFTGVITISGNAFRGSSIQEITFPGSVTTVEDSAFNGCASLKTLNINEGCQTFKSQWIWGCIPLELLVFPSTTIDITGYGLIAYRASYDVICKAVTPPSLGSSSYNQVIKSIFVPDSSVDSYKAASVWSNLSSKIKPLSEYSEE